VSKTFVCKVSEVCENGDAIIELPDEFVNELDWRVGDEIDYSLEGKSVIIKNLTKEKRNETNS
jgi:uncharacterized membrane protein (UPF0127 family)